MQNALMAEISNLSVAERILLVEEIWDHIADTEDSAFALSDSQCAELDRRITQYQNQPDAGRSWNDVKEEYFRGKTADAGPAFTRSRGRASRRCIVV